MRPRCSRYNAYWWAAISSLLAISPPGLAEDASCSAERPIVIPRSAVDSAAQEVRISAGHTLTEQGNLYILEDNVKLEQAGRALYGDKMTYDKEKDTADANGNVRYEQQGIILTGDHATINLTENRAQIDNAQYTLGDQQIRGTATHIAMQVDSVTLKNATYTTCRPNQDHWLLSASELHVDKESSTGTARNVVLDIFGIPSLYFPYINFSLGPRKSGLLPPLFANSDMNGFDIAMPYYWNIAPDRDATLVPRYMTRRGTQLGAEFRYLNRPNRGTLSAEWMPRDLLRDEQRAYLSWDHNQQIDSHTDGNLLYAQVSDTAYFHELGSNLTVSSQSFLERRARIRYNSERLSVTGLAQNYQSLDTALTKPYQRLPQLTAVWRQGWNSLHTEMIADYVHFFRGDGDRAQRLHAAPRVGLRWRSEAGFIEPGATWHTTRYYLPKGGSSYLTVPSASVSTGFYLDKDDQARRHTLEPQLFYTYTPYHDQSSLPIFESAIPEISLSQLLREDRLIGIDRIGDQQRVVGALTYRNFNRLRGVEELISSGAVVYRINDERVTLTPDQAIARGGTYDFFASVDSRWGPVWTAHGDLYWPNTDKVPAKGAALLKYSSPNGGGELAYRYRRNQWELVQASLGWRPSAKWRLAARANYSLNTQSIVETVAGFEYSDCCWGIGAIVRRYVTGLQGDINTAYGLQFELKGLSTVGSRLEQGLARDLFTF